MNPGTTIVLRDIFWGEVWFAWPLVTLEADASRVLAYQLPGATGAVPIGYPDDMNLFFEQLLKRHRVLVELAWSRTIALHVIERDQHWGTRLFWDHVDGSFLGYYVDFRKPVIPRGAVLDTCDLFLDIVVAPDGTWSWKDEEEFEWAVNADIVTSASADSVRLAREDAVQRIESRSFPFDGSLTSRLPPRADPPTVGAHWLEYSIGSGPDSPW